MKHWLISLKERERTNESLFCYIKIYREVFFCFINGRGVVMVNESFLAKNKTNVVKCNYMLNSDTSEICSSIAHKQLTNMEYPTFFFDLPTELTSIILL